MPTTAAIFQTIRNAHHSCDADALTNVFADDAEIIEYSQANPPSAPARFSGRAQIEAHFKDIMARDLTHEVGDEVIGEDRFSFTVACKYGSGQRVHEMATCRVQDGKITEKVSVLTWDA